jgi:hypothetical protein
LGYRLFFYGFLLPEAMNTLHFLPYFQYLLSSMNNGLSRETKKRIKQYQREQAQLAPKISNAVFIFERPQVSFKIHPDLEKEVYRITDTRLDYKKEWAEPFTYFNDFRENMYQYLNSHKKIILVRYNAILANQIGFIFLKFKKNQKPFSCIAFYHNGERLKAPDPTPEEYFKPVDFSTTALESMYYFDFIKKIEIPVDYELTWDFVSECINAH